MNKIPKPLRLLKYILIVYIILFAGVKIANAQTVPDVPPVLSIRIENNRLYIESCSINLLSNMGYRGFVGTTEVFSTGAFGGFPCYSGDLFITDLHNFYLPFLGSEFDANFDFYRNIDSSGPIYKTFSIHYDGTNFSLPSQMSGNSNVLFIPGLLSSRLYRDNGVVNCSFNCEDQIWEPDLLERVNDLYLDNNGDSIVSNIYTRDIIDTASMLGVLRSNFYKNIIEKLNDLKLQDEINDWNSWAYDWRKDVNDLVENGTEYENDQIVNLVDTLQTLKNNSKNGKVTIVTHSNGGLVAKALINKLQLMKSGNQTSLVDSIDKLVLIASPQIGTPEAFTTILHGYGRQIPFVISELESRKLSRNMPSSYGLLPSEKYFEQAGLGPVAEFSSTSPIVFRNFYGTDIGNFSKQNNFILGSEGRVEPAENNLISPIIGNSLLLSKANTLHSVIDNMTIPSTIQVITVAGWGKETISGIKYTDTDIEPIYTLDGDKTVVSGSAQYGGGTKYWVDLSNSKIEHKNITENPELLTFIENLIKGENITLSTIKPSQNGDRLQIGVHSPVSLGVYDAMGNFTGKVCQNNTCDVVEDIPGSSYDEFGEGKYVNLGKGNLQKVVLQGTGIGTFTYDSKVVAPNGSAVVSRFIDIPVTTQTTAEITLKVGDVPEMKLDVTGDGILDITLLPTNEFNPITFLEVMKKTVDSLDVVEAKRIALNKRIDNIIKQIEKGKVDKAKLKADKFKNALGKKLEKPDPKHSKPKKLSKTDAQLLLDMLTKLLDNLG